MRRTPTLRRILLIGLLVLVTRTLPVRYYP